MGRVRCAVKADLRSVSVAAALARLGPTDYHRLSWSYLDDLPRWRHLKKQRPGIEGQLSFDVT